MLNHSRLCIGSSLFLFALAISTQLSALEHVEKTTNTHPSGHEKKCLYISSYHVGFAWSDAIESSIRETLGGACELRQINMDTQRNNSPEAIFNATNQAIKIIEEWLPDIVITSDDNAAKHIIAPHYKDSVIPFVFSGVNWTVEEYGFPYTNVTGIVEVAPVKSMLEQARLMSGGQRGLYIGATAPAENKNFERIANVATELGMEINPVYAPHLSHWVEALQTSADYDFVLLGDKAGIVGWDEQRASEAALKFSTKVSLTNHESMMPYTAIGLTKSAYEQGNWAATAAIKILSGAKPADIPIVSNKVWDIWVNESLLDKLQIKASRHLMRKAKRVKPVEKILSATGVE